MEEKKVNVGNRNSILEILRLFASLWVMYYHGLSLISRSEMFRNGRIAVDFFFILSGFYLIKSFIKEKDKPYLVGLKSLIYKRIKPISVTFLICFIFQLISYIQFYEGFFENSIWGYLWYIPHMLVTFTVYFTLFKIIKNKKMFNVVTVILSAICYFLILTYVTNYGIFRGVAGVGAGILLSQLPKCKLKWSKNILSPILAALLFIAIFVISILHPETVIQDILCLIILFPMLIYFSSQIQFSSKLINNICSISLGLYMYQTVASLLEENLIIVEGSILFLIVLVLSIIDRVIAYFLKCKRIKKAVSV